MPERAYQYPPYSVHVEYYKNGSKIKTDTPETANSAGEAKKYFDRAIRLAFVEDYGQDEVYVHIFHFDRQTKFKAVRQDAKANPGFMKCKAIRVRNGNLEILR